jgi:hypothetical protein
MKKEKDENKIENAHLSRLTNADHCELTYKLMMALDSDNENVPNLKDYIKKFVEAAKKEQYIDFDTTRSNPYTKENAELDMKRYKDAVALREILRSLSKTSLHIAEKAKKEYEFLKKVKLDIHCPYNERDRQMEEFIDRMVGHGTFIQDLGLKDLYKEIIDLNYKCKRISMKKELEANEGGRRQYTVARAATDEAYYEMVNRLHAYCIVADNKADDEYVKLRKIINGVIRRFFSEKKRVEAIRAHYAKKKEGDEQ